MVKRYILRVWGAGGDPNGFSGAHGRHLGLEVEPLEHFFGMQISSRVFSAFLVDFDPGPGGGGKGLRPPETTVKAPAAGP